MAKVTIKHIDEIESYKGKDAIDGIRFLPAAKTLGVTAWGMNVIKIEPNCLNYPEHNHEEDGQEEVYVILNGKATLQAGGEKWELEPGMMVRVDPTQKRKFVTGADKVTILAIGNTPGKAYPAKD